MAPHTVPLPMALLLLFCRVSPYGRIVQQLRLDLWKACFDSCCCPHVGCFLMSPRIRTHVNNRTMRSHSPPTSYSAGATCSATRCSEMEALAEPGSKLTSITGGLSENRDAPIFGLSLGVSKGIGEVTIVKLKMQESHRFAPAALWAYPDKITLSDIRAVCLSHFLEGKGDGPPPSEGVRGKSVGGSDRATPLGISIYLHLS